MWNAEKHGIPGFSTANGPHRGRRQDEKPSAVSDSNQVLLRIMNVARTDYGWRGLELKIEAAVRQLKVLMNMSRE